MKNVYYLKPAKKNNAVFFLPLLLLTLLICNCKSQTVDDETAVKIYVENLIVEEKYSAIPDSIEIHRQKVFSNFNSSKKDFDEYLSSIKNNPEKWESFFKKADSYLNELKKNGKIK